MIRTTIARGVYRDTYGYEIRWRDLGIPRSKRFPLDTPIEQLKAWRSTRIRQAREKREPLGSFVRDATRWLARRKHLPSFKSDRAHLRPWIHRFGRASRFAVTRDGVQGAIHYWHAQGYSPRELRHRWHILHQFFAAVDPDEQNPCRGVKLPAVVRTRPRPVSDETITAVATQLYRQEITKRLRDAKTRARFLVLVTTGIRPAQLKRALPVDINLDARIWIVQPAKGDKGSAIYLNDEMLQAARLFISAHAWGWFDGRSFVKVLYRNGWPKGVRPYTARHAVGQTLRRRGADLGDIQDHLGHRSPATTAAFYLEPDLERLKATSEKLSGRVGLTAFLPPPTATSGKKQTAKDGENPPHSSRYRRQEKSRLRSGRTAKTA